MQASTEIRPEKFNNYFRPLSVILLFFCLFSYFAHSQNVVINGEAKWAIGKTIKLITYTDRLTQIEKTLITAKVDTSGWFILKTDIPATIQSFIRVNNSSDELFIEPGMVYNIRIYLDKSKAANNKENSYLRKGNLIIDFINPDMNEINNLIRRFNFLCNDFIIHDIEKILKTRSKLKLDSFKTAIQGEFKDINNEYFKNLMFYRTGSIEYFTRLKSNADIEKEYFYNKPILYDNYEYMDFFNDFFSKYISSSNFFNYSELDNIINSKAGNYSDLISLYRKDTLIKNKDFLDIVIIKQFDYLYHTKGFKKENILRLLKEAELKSSTKQNKIIASNLYKLLTKLAPYSKAPAFRLKDTDEKIVSLNDFKGKYVYLTFFKSSINSCLAELKLLNVIAEKYSDNIAFICISADDDRKLLNRFIKENPGTKLQLLFFNYDMDLLNNYEAKTFPTFILIDKEGDIVSYPAPKPSEQINKIFDNELKRER